MGITQGFAPVADHGQVDGVLAGGGDGGGAPFVGLEAGLKVACRGVALGQGTVGPCLERRATHRGTGVPADERIMGLPADERTAVLPPDDRTDRFPGPGPTRRLTRTAGLRPDHHVIAAMCLRVGRQVVRIVGPGLTHRLTRTAGLQPGHQVIRAMGPPPDDRTDRLPGPRPTRTVGLQPDHHVIPAVGLRAMGLPPGRQVVRIVGHGDNLLVRKIS